MAFNLIITYNNRQLYLYTFFACSFKYIWYISHIFIHPSIICWTILFVRIKYKSWWPARLVDTNRSWEILSLFWKSYHTTMFWNCCMDYFWINYTSVFTTGKCFAYSSASELLKQILYDFPFAEFYKSVLLVGECCH